MTTAKTRLELTWIGKGTKPRLEPRILIEDPARSHLAARRVSPDDLFDNRLIHGDNLLALRALEQEFTGKIRCVYIDPPFNTGQAFEHYEDGLEHSLWLSLMRDRLTILHRLLADDGTLFVHIDDNELGYLIVLLDEIFGRGNRASVVTFKQGAPTGHKAINPGCVTTSNFVLIYAKDRRCWAPSRMFVARERDTRYSQFIANRNEHHSRWRIIPLLHAFAEAKGLAEKEARDLVKKSSEALDQFVLENSEAVVRLARPDYKAISAAAREMVDRSKAQPEKVLHLQRDDHSDFYFIRGERILFYAGKLKEIDGEVVSGEPLTTIWDDLLSNNIHKEGGVAFPKGKKPEALLKRIIEMSTRKGDWVLDSFAGSGTTGAVAHKLGRRWILVELGEHCDSLVVPRLQSVIDGRDESGATTAVAWRGGGGFRFYRLAPSLLERDPWGNWIINKQYNPAMLSEAVCKHEGFRYAPSSTAYWQHGRSTETDFIYVTTQTLTREQLEQLSYEVGNKRTLLICCGAFRVKADAFPNLTIKKIPNAVLHRCEWGHDDYSLALSQLGEPALPPSDSSTPSGATSSKKPSRSRSKATAQTLPLFREEK